MRRSTAIDAAGALLVAGLVAWVFVAQGRSGGEAAPLAALAAGCAAIFVAARGVAYSVPALVPAAVALIAAALVVQSPADVFSRQPLRGPLHYANARSALFALAAIAALMVYLQTAGTLRAAAAVAGITFAAVPIVVGTLAAAGLVLALPIGVAVASGRRVARYVTGGYGVLFLLVLAGTALIGAWHGATRDRPPLDPAPVERMSVPVRETLSERRSVLWSEAVAMARARPLTGVGPGRFRAVSPTAIGDPDASWAHNCFLQLGAETGVPGFALGVAVILWVFARLAFVARPGRLTVAGAAAVAALAIHACVDYPAHFPVLPLIAAALAGAACGVANEDDDDMGEATR